MKTNWKKLRESEESRIQKEVIRRAKIRDVLWVVLGVALVALTVVNIWFNW